MGIKQPDQPLKIQETIIKEGDISGEDVFLREEILRSPQKDFKIRSKSKPKISTTQIRTP